MDSNLPSLPSYSEHREQFLAVAHQAGARLSEYLHPLKGPNGESLACDVAIIGRPQASRVLMVLSGTHGVEGFFGSVCQRNALQEFAQQPLPEDVAVVMIHLINPWGCAWLRRVNEDNIDLNRNYLDFTQALPHNLAYEELHAVYTCPELDGPLRQQADEQYAEQVQRLGWERYMSIVGAGQYRHADGVFYGGQQATWSHLTLQRIISEHLVHARQLISFDLHSGDGDFGNPMLIAIAERDYPALDTARRLYGPWLHEVFSHSDRRSATGIVATATGYTSQALLDTLPNSHLSALVIECGTYESAAVHGCLRDDHWLHLYGDPLDRVGLTIKRRLAEHFRPADADWQALVSFRSRRLFQQALQGLKASELR